jgi:hypothetical protein
VPNLFLFGSGLVSDPRPSCRLRLPPAPIVSVHRPSRASLWPPTAPFHPRPTCRLRSGLRRLPSILGQPVGFVLASDGSLPASAELAAAFGLRRLLAASADLSASSGFRRLPSGLGEPGGLRSGLRRLPSGLGEPVCLSFWPPTIPFWPRRTSLPSFWPPTAPLRPWPPVDFVLAFDGTRQAVAARSRQPIRLSPKVPRSPAARWSPWAIRS